MLTRSLIIIFFLSQKTEERNILVSVVTVVVVVPGDVVVVCGKVDVTMTPVVVKLATGVVVLRAYIVLRRIKHIELISSFCYCLTLVETVCVVGAVVVVVVVLERPGSQISNCQKAGSVIGDDSASMKVFTMRYINWKESVNLRQKSLPLVAPLKK